MQPDPGKNRRPVITEKRPRSASTINRKRLRFWPFLIETKFLPLVLLGQAGQYFGFRAVGAFSLGAACLYGYAVFRPLPYILGKPLQSAQIAPPPMEAKTIRLHGVVKNSAGEPAKWFNVGVFANRLGPLDNSDGSFTLNVPESNSYDVVFWTTDEKIHVFQGNTAERDGTGYRLQNALKLTPLDRYASAARTRPRNPAPEGQIARLGSDAQ